MPGIDRALVAGLWANSDAASNSDEKGKLLEDLICYVFERIPGVSTAHRNVVNAFGTEEVDVAFFNARRRDGLFFIDDNSLLVECKNWSKPVDGQEIVYFAWRLRNRNLRHGILVAASGITGKPEHLQQARYKIGVTLSSFGIRILVVDRTELLSVSDGTELAQLLLGKRLDLDAKQTCF